MANHEFTNLRNEVAALRAKIEELEGRATAAESPRDWHQVENKSIDYWHLVDNAVQNSAMDNISGATYTTVQHMTNLFHSAGWFSGGTVTDGGSNTVNVAAGTGAIRTTNSSVGTLQFFDWAAASGQSVPSNTIRYVGVEYNSGSPQVVVKTSESWNYTTDFPLAIAVNEAGTIHIVNAPWEIGDHSNFMIQRSIDTTRIARNNYGGGLILGETGTRNITVTAGSLWYGLSEFTISAIDTSGAGTFDRYYRNGSGGWTKEASQTTWNNTQYDNNSGSLATMTAAKYSLQFFYLELDGALVSLYGQNQYNTLADVQNVSPPSTVPDRVSAHAIYIGAVLFQKSDVSANQVISPFTTVVGGTAVVTDHGSLSGLDDSADHDWAMAGDRYVMVSDVKAANTAGGTFTNGDWRTRTINTEDSDDGSLCSISSNQITLAAGTYICRISAPAVNVNAHKTRLYNTTGTTTLLLGTSEYSAAGVNGSSRSFISGKFTVAASQALEVQHRCNSSQTTTGFGVQSNFSVSEVYTIAEFWKVG